MAFAAGHLAGVGFVVVAGEMKQAMEDENFDFDGERMALFDGLRRAVGTLMARSPAIFSSAPMPSARKSLQRKGALSGKGEHVGGLVFVAELAVEFANGRVGGEQDGDLAAKADGGLRLSEKAGQRSGGGQAEIFVLGGGRPLR